MKKFISWLLVSSANPDNVSLTVKGILVALIPTIVSFAPVIGIHVTSPGITDLFVGFAELLRGSLVVIGTSLTIYGAIRKLILTHAV